MKDFVDKDSIVRTIWGNPDTILLIFAGASAEFALNKSVDWLYFTGKLPSDPLGRLFSTVTYAQKIVFASEKDAFQVIHSMNSIHNSVSKARGFQIPNHSFHDVLNMLIDYSIISFQVLERPLTYAEKEEVFNVFIRLGNRMGIQNLPNSFNEWCILRQSYLMKHLENSTNSKDLFQQYRNHLGLIRYFILTETYRLLTPPQVKKLMNLKRSSLLKWLIVPYKLSRAIKLDLLFKSLLFPKAFQKDIANLNNQTSLN